MKFDTDQFPGVSVTLLEESPGEAIEAGRGKIRVVNESSRAFQVHAGIGKTVVISAGGTKEFDVEGETFDMGWHDPELAERIRAAAAVHASVLAASLLPPPNPPLSDADVEALKKKNDAEHRLRIAAEEERLADGDALARERLDGADPESTVPEDPPPA